MLIKTNRKWIADDASSSGAGGSPCDRNQKRKGEASRE